MTSIFFLLYSMNVGGVEKSLLGLLSTLPQEKYEVHVGLVHKEGGFLSFLPQGVIVHAIDCYASIWHLINDPPKKVILEMIKKWKIIDAIIHSFLYVHYKLTSNRYLFYKYILRNEPVFPIAFDIAVSYAGPSQMMDYYICKKVKAKQKIGWIHFDVSKIGVDKRMMGQLYVYYDKIFIVSESGKNVFDSMFPQFSYKTAVFHNIVSCQQVSAMAEKGPTFDDDYKGTRVLTVGRISKEKGQRTAIDALQILLRDGYDVKWYFVGEGDDRDCCELLAHELYVSESVMFLGLQINPYGYMKDCDVYVQPSRYEGFCITLAEALCFSHPIVATDFVGASEQLNNKNGIVVGFSAEDIARGIEHIIDNSK